MGLDFFRRSVELAERYLRAGPARRAHDPDQRHAARRRVGARSSSEHDFLVGLSIDGPREMHDTYRVNKGGKGTLRPGDARAGPCAKRGVDCNALTTVHAANADRGREVYRFLRDELRRAVHAVHPDHRARRRELPMPTAGAWTRGAIARSTCRRATGHRALGDRRAVRALPDRRLRGVGAPRRRRGLRADVRRRARELGTASRRACAFTRRPAGSRSRSSTTATSTPATTSSSRRYMLGNIGETHMLELVASPQQRQFGHDKRDTLPALLPRVRRALRLPRRVPEGPLHRRRPTASRGSTTSAPATRRSSTTSTRRCARCATCCARTARRRRSCSSTRPRTRSADATTPAPAARAASGSTATEESPGAAADVSASSAPLIVPSAAVSPGLTPPFASATAFATPRTSARIASVSSGAFAASAERAMPIDASVSVSTSCGDAVTPNPVPRTLAISRTRSLGFESC